MNTKQTEALKLAQDLRALADRFSEGWHEGIKIDALDIELLANAAEALAEQPSQQEPVAWMHEWEDGERIPMLTGRDDRNNDQPKSVRPLVYGDNPQAQRTWVGLTDEDIGRCFDAGDGTIGGLIAAIEAKLREKNA